MKIVIAYLYYDLLNLYGEKGNLKEIIKELKNQDINYEIKYLSINDDLKFENYDLVIMNAGTENNQEIVIKHLKKYKKELKKAIENNKFFLITGNAIDLFGRNLLKNKKKFLGIFKYDIVRTDKRIVNDALFKDQNDNLIIGFQNQSSYLTNIKYPLFTKVIGFGSNSKVEGIHYKNFYGTYLLGPLLIRNPLFFESFLKNLILSKVKNFDFKDFNLELEIEAYKTFVELHYSQYITNVNSFIS